MLKSPSLPSLDYGWAFRHPTAGLILFGLLLLFGTALVAWIAERVERVQGQGRAGIRRLQRPLVLPPPRRAWQLLGLDAPPRHDLLLPARLRDSGDAYNALLVQVSQSLATILPVSPAGIGTEQAFLVYMFRNVTTKSVALSFSVGMRVTLIVVNASSASPRSCS